MMRIFETYAGSSKGESKVWAVVTKINENIVADVFKACSFNTFRNNKYDAIDIVLVS